jgi:hypothetical protein
VKQTLLFVEMPDSISWYHLFSQSCSRSRGVFSIMVGWGSVRWRGVGVVWLTMPTTLAHSFDATLSGVQSRITCTVSFTQLLSACLREAHLHMHNFPKLACISRILLKFSWYVPGKCCDAKGDIRSVGWRRLSHGIRLRAMKKNIERAPDQNWLQTEQQWLCKGFARTKFLERPCNVRTIATGFTQ